MEAFYKKFIYVTFLCAVFCFAWSTQDKKNLRIPVEIVLRFRQQAEACEKETGVPASQLPKILDKTLPKDLKSLQFFQCVVLNIGLIEPNGRLVVEKMTSFEVVDGTVEEYVNNINECNKLVTKDNLKSLDAISDCIHKAYRFTAVSPK